MILDQHTLSLVVGRAMKDPVVGAFLCGLNKFGAEKGLNLPHRLAQYVAQMAHESGGFKYNSEIWGPTPAQARYEGRRDLGNLSRGDGFSFRGRTAIQITGRTNYRGFTIWARRLDPKAPDFEGDPDLVLTDPWEGLGPIWYWDTRELNRLADQGNIEMITRRINGGFNGLADRLRYFERAALVLLGYAPDAVRLFQRDNGLAVDGISGPMTRAKLHKALAALPPIEAAPTAPKSPLSAILSLIASLLKGMKA